MADSRDLFFSYRRHDLESAQPLLNALDQLGVRIWRDENDIPEQASITEEIRRGIAASKAFLAFYSRTYPESKPCQEELTAAWLAAQHIDGGTANRRVWVINPESDLEHIPDLLRDRQSRFAGAGAPELARTLKQRLDTLDAALGSGARGAPPYHGMSPIQAARFTGRVNELWDLHGKLTANRAAIITGVYGQAAAQVRGLAGNGKSLLAREYAIRFGPAYPGGVFWLNAYGNDGTQGSQNHEQREGLRLDQVRAFAVECGVPVMGLKPEEIEAAFWLEIEQRNQPCLWIVDDVPSGLTLRELERDWNAHWPGSSILMTTRSREYGEVGKALDLGVLAPKEARRLLYSHRQPADSAEKSAAERIVELVGCHPLAADVAGSYLAQGFESFAGYAASLANPREDAMELGAELRESLPTDHDRSIGATLLSAIKRLPPEGLDFLRLASILAVAPIPIHLISEVIEALDGDGSGKSRSRKGVNQVETASLCERSGADVREDARTVHTLVSRTMRFRFPDDARTAALTVAAVRVLTNRLARIGHAGEHFKIASDMPHARRLVPDNLQTADEASLAAWIAQRDRERGDYGSARKLQEQVLAASRRLLGEEHPDTLTAMHNLAATQCEQGYLPGARKLQERVLAASRRLLGEEHPDTLQAMNNLAQTQQAQGDLPGARKLQEQVLAARRGLLGEEHPDTLQAMNNLAQTQQAQGDLPGARKLQEQVLAALRRLLGEEHPHTLTAMLNLAQMQNEQGDLPGARKLQEQVLAASRRLLGEEHPDTLTAMNNLALTLQDLDDLPGARKLQEQVLAASRRLLGEEHPDTLTAMNNLALTLQDLDDLPGARKLQEQVLAARRRVLGEEHPDTLAAMNNLAQMR